MIPSTLDLKRLVHRMIARRPDGKTTFFDVRSFAWVDEVAAESKAMVAELRALLVAERESAARFQSISSEMQFLTGQRHWKTYFLYVYGHRIDANCGRCPETARVVNQIPGMMTAMFSVLEAGKELPEHRGMYKGLLRYQLGLIVPAPIIHCGIRVGRDVRNWYEGESLIFDDTHPHEVWNYSSSLRSVLFVDFARPLPMPLSLANRTMLKAIAATDVVTSAVQRLRQPELMVRAHTIL